MKYAFIQANEATFEVKILCRVLEVSRSAYYAWLKRPVSEREQANQALRGAIQAAHERSRCTYGSPRIHAELKRQGVCCSRKRVERLMREQGVRARLRKHYQQTTHSQHDYPVAPNLLNREFQAERINQKWLSDITYIPTLEGWLYLGVVLDVFSRKIVGWAMAPHMEQSLVAAALQMALVHRQPQLPLLHHSDRGSQYAATPYQDLLSTHHITVSMSGAGNCYDNAMMESFFSTLKAECVTQPYATRQEARLSIFEYIEVWYNRQRSHSALGYQSPSDFESAVFTVS